MPEKVVHRLAEIIRFRLLMIAAGYEDGNDADALRDNPMFLLALAIRRQINPSARLLLAEIRCSPWCVVEKALKIRKKVARHILKEPQPKHRYHVIPT